MSFREISLKALISILLILALAAAGTVRAQAQAPQYPCEQNERFAEFDFWIGDWEVHGPKGKLAGSNSIVSREHGCVLTESWTGASGVTGMSINYLDHATGEWVQVWNDSSGSQINIRGGLTDDGMLLVGTIHYVASNQTAPFRGLWTQLDDGRVRQFFEQYDAENDAWNTWFEGFYTRKAAE